MGDFKLKTKMSFKRTKSRLRNLRPLSLTPSIKHRLNGADPTASDLEISEESTQSDTLPERPIPRLSKTKRAKSADALNKRHSVVQSLVSGVADNETIKALVRRERPLSFGNEVMLIRWMLQAKKRNHSVKTESTGGKIFLDEEELEKRQRIEIEQKRSGDRYIEWLLAQPEPDFQRPEITNSFWSKKALQDRLSENFNNRAVSWILLEDRLLEFSSEQVDDGGEDGEKKIILTKRIPAKMEILHGCGRFDFGDGFKYGGEVDPVKMMTHGHGVLMGPCGTFSGLWAHGMQTLGVHTWYIGAKFEGTWKNGLRHGYGVEYRPRWVYEGEWKNDRKTGYGVLKSRCGAKYEGTWQDGTQDGYGVETYADGGFYIGQWHAGMRHGYGVRVSHSHTSAEVMLNILNQLPPGTTDVWSISNFPETHARRNEADNVFEEVNPTGSRRNGTVPTTQLEVYRGDWANDKRSGFGVLKVSSSTSYEGEWHHNLQNGYGAVKHSDSRLESGKWSDNTRILVRKNIFTSNNRNFSTEVNRAVELARYAALEADKKSLTVLQRIHGAKREGDNAVKISEQARAHSAQADAKLKESVESPVKRRGRPDESKTEMWCESVYEETQGDTTDYTTADCTSDINTTPETSDVESEVEEESGESVEPQCYDEVMLDNTEDDQGPSRSNGSFSATEFRATKLRSIDERSEISSPSNRSSYVYLCREISFRGAARTPVIISPVARSIFLQSRANSRLSNASSNNSLASGGGSSVNLTQYTGHMSNNYTAEK